MISQTGAAGKPGEAPSPFGLGFCFMCDGAIRSDGSCDCSPACATAQASAEASRFAEVCAAARAEFGPRPGDEIETCAREIARLVGDAGDDLNRFELCDLVQGFAARIARARLLERSPSLSGLS